MSRIQLHLSLDGVMARYANQIGALGDRKVKTALQRALRHTGDKARTRVRTELTKQTGLKKSTIIKALKVRKPNYADLSYEMWTSGGNISLKHFKPRETRTGVSAAPRGKRTIYKHTFMKAGWWPKRGKQSNRVTKPNWNGQVFLAHHNPRGKDKFEKQKSGVFIPEEMVKGTTLSAWREIADRDFVNRVGHEIERLLPK